MESSRHIEGRGLAGTVWAEEGHDLARGHDEIDPVEDFDLAVAGTHVTQLEQRWLGHAGGRLEVTAEPR